MKTLNEARMIAGVGIKELADSLDVSYISLAKIFRQSPIEIANYICNEFKCEYV